MTRNGGAAVVETLAAHGVDTVFGIPGTHDLLPIPIVVADNGGFGEIRTQQQVRGIPPVAVDLHTPDLVAPARAMGADAVAVEDPAAVAEHVQRGLAADRPTLIRIAL